MSAKKAIINGGNTTYTLKTIQKNHTKHKENVICKMKLWLKSMLPTSVAKKYKIK